jgi:hypothetical protein
MRYLILAIFPIVVHAGTDFSCVNDCTAKGYMYGLCQQRCSFGSNDSTFELPKPKQTDFQCVNQCTSQGMMYQLCQERCSY